MADLIHDFIFATAHRTPAAEALVDGTRRLDYAALAAAVEGAAGALLDAGVARRDRVAVYLDKRVENVAAMFGAALAGAVFVPVNPQLKPAQVAHILADCNVKVLLTSPERLDSLAAVLEDCPELSRVFVTGEARPGAPAWSAVQRRPAPEELVVRRAIDADMAAILYTSGSTGKPKGVVLSHRNMVAGARSVASYLRLDERDRILSVLPLSFDYGLSQLTCAFLTGAAVVLMNYLFPKDIVKAVATERITGLAAVPPLWLQLGALAWPPDCTLRYLTNSGGAMPRHGVDALRRALPQAELFLMYGLTEAFRSTYLPPVELDRRPDSMGRAIPNAEIMVVRPDGSPCDPDEPGELVHRGALVSLGYWNDPARTAERFRPAPGQPAGLPLPEMAVWSGDTVRMDSDGYLYFISRADDMIKVSGYRVSPSEVEEAVYATGLALEAVAFGVPHPALGEGIVLLVLPAREELDTAELLRQCQRRLPAWMMPAHVELCRQPVPRNPNGKIDRKTLRDAYLHLFDAA